MAQLYFYYSAMNAGKSTAMLQSAYNYKERGMNALVMTAALDGRYGFGKVTSRIGLQSDAYVFSRGTQLIEIVTSVHEADQVHCVLIDEAQFLTKAQVHRKRSI